MSRSYKKNPYAGICADSDKECKKRLHRAFRRKEKVSLKQDKEPPFSHNQVMTEWDMDKDGKWYLGGWVRSLMIY